MSGWRPIETAPHDNTEVDLWVVKGEMGYRLTNAYWLEADHDHDAGWYYESEDGREKLEGPAWPDRATHWMPIPGAPAI